MTHADLLRRSIDHATGEPVTPPDLDLLKRRGRRRSALRTAGAALATLGVVAAGTVAVQSVVGNEVSPASVPDGHSAAYLSYGASSEVLHWGERALTVEHARSTQMPAMTKAGLVYLGGDGTPYLLDESGDETRLGDPVDRPPGRRDGWAMVVSDTRGDYAAWAHYTRDELTISLFDARTRTVTTSAPFDCASVAPGCDYASAQVVSDGVVYVTGSVGAGAHDSTIAWDPSRPEGERLYPLTDPGTSLAAAGPGQLVLDGSGDAYGGPGRAPLPPSTDVTRLGGDEYRDALSVPMSADGRWRIVDPGRFIESGGDRDDPVRTALNVVNGRTLEVDVPGEIIDVTFDADDSLLLIAVTDGDQRMYDCAIPSGACTTVVEHLDGTDAVFADGGIR